MSSSTSKSRRKDAGHYEWYEGEVLNNRYIVKKSLGDGTFGRVLGVTDADGTHKAIKVVRAVHRYVEVAKIEAQVLKRANAADPYGHSHLVRLLDDFALGANYCLVFEALGKSLYDLIKLNKYKGEEYEGFPVHMVKAIAKQVAQALSFMHKLDLTHTDLKLENVLLVSEELYWDADRVRSD